VPFAIQELQSAFKAYRQFLEREPPVHHARYIFPFFTGSYFAYRKIDVLRVVAVSRSISSEPSFVDIGCGYGDFLGRIRERIPGAIGIEQEPRLFYSFQIPKPEYVLLVPVEGYSRNVDVAFVGWMEPGQDFRDPVAHCSDVIVTTLDQGISLAAEFDGHGFDRVAWWRTPSWEDVNIEIMNRHYTKIPEARRAELHRMRGAHNLWYVYTKPEHAASARAGLRTALESEDPGDRFDFESVLDECGFGYLEELSSLARGSRLWEVNFD